MTSPVVTGPFALGEALTGRERGPEMADFMALMQALPKAPAGA